jgi:hypothetical protein
MATHARAQPTWCLPVAGPATTRAGAAHRQPPQRVPSPLGGPAQAAGRGGAGPPSSSGRQGKEGPRGERSSSPVRGSGSSGGSGSGSGGSPKQPGGLTSLWKRGFPPGADWGSFLGALAVQGAVGGA